MTDRERKAGKLIISGEERPYTTTVNGCTCKDWQYRGKRTGQPCYHMIAERTAAELQASTRSCGRPPAATAPASCTCAVYKLRGSCDHVPDVDGF